MAHSPTPTVLQCFHCGEAIQNVHIHFDQKDFCCQGCKSVYELLHENDLESFYLIDKENPVKIGEVKPLAAFEFLDDPLLENQLLDFKSDEKCIITFNAPAIHCSSCIWLLEHLHKIHAGILRSEVHFLEKKINIQYHPKKIDLKNLVYLLSKIGYPPELTLDGVEAKSLPRKNRALWYKLGVAGFAFGNIMLFSLPSYFGLTESGVDASFDQVFKWFNLVLSIPVLLYAGSDFLKSAYRSILHKQINLDVPLCIGILALFGTSVYEILSQTGPGYLDSFSALIFFLLAGRAIQQSSFEKLKFDRDFSSYFPLSVLKMLSDGKTKSIPVKDVQPGDRVFIRHQELIPTDAIVCSGIASIDYSFVTGESAPCSVKQGEKVYAGGRQMGGAIILEVQKSVSQSYLTQLWNNHTHEKNLTEDYETVVNQRSKYFTYAVLVVSIGTLAYWWYNDSFAKGILIMATTLNVSCPCALAVAIPFTYAAMMRQLSKRKCYIKNTQVIERSTQVQHLVFDKTGTLTRRSQDLVHYHGIPCSQIELDALASGLQQSTHPLSVQLFANLNPESYPITQVQECIGKGLLISTTNNAKIEIKIGSKSFAGSDAIEEPVTGNRLYVQINDLYRGYFELETPWLNGLQSMCTELEDLNLKMSVVSGDREQNRKDTVAQVGSHVEVLMEQKPDEKWKYIEEKQQYGIKTMMIGDGLNDGLAIQSSHVGVAVVHQHSQFSPASDIILASESVIHLPSILQYMRKGIGIVKAGFIFSSLYNCIGLTVAAQGLFSPAFAALLMPISSVTVVAFTVGLSNALAKRILPTTEIK